MNRLGRRLAQALQNGAAGICCLLLTALTGTPPVQAQGTTVDLELVLAVDISGSIDPVEAKLQREGYMAALASREVLEAIRSGVLGRIAVTYVEWAGIQHQETLVGWRIIESEADARGFVDALAEMPLRRARRTSISGAIAYAAPLFRDNGIDSTRQVIDISGDGPNNSGPMAPGARDEALAEGIVINGLPIINDRPNPFGLRTMRDLDLYYKHCVIGGPGAFIVVARSFDDFASAVLSKLILEITDRRPVPDGITRHAALAPRPAPPLARLPAPVDAAPLRLAQSSGSGLPAAPKPALPEGIADCDAGERQWQRFRQGFDNWP
jgi:hypothetical protein